MGCPDAVLAVKVITMFPHCHSPPVQGQECLWTRCSCYWTSSCARLHGDDWYKAERISRRKLEEKYPAACRFRKTDGNIAAIDFGGSFCSLAFTIARDSDLMLQQVEINTLKLNKYHPRVPIAILLKEAKSVVPGSDDDPVSKTCEYEIVAFGYDAVNIHSALKPSERSKHLYFELFMMPLRSNEVYIHHD